MKNRLIVYGGLFLMALIGACGSFLPDSILPADTMKSPKPTRALETGTPTIVATVNSAATIIVLSTKERAANLTSEAVNVEMAQVNTHNKELEIQAGQLTLASNQLTAADEAISAQQTFVAVTNIPLTVKAEQANKEYKIKEMEYNKVLPDIIRKKADSEAYAENAGWSMTVDIFMRFAFGILLASGGIALVSFAARKAADEQAPSGLVDMNKRELPQFKPVQNRDGADIRRRINTDIPCPLYILLTLSDGIVDDGKTLAFKQWEGTPVHKYMKYIRDWAVSNHFARLLPRQGGELVITEGHEECGLYFFQHTAEAGKPPPPYKCAVVEETQQGE